VSVQEEIHLREYETTIIVQPEISDEGSAAIFERLEGILADQGSVRLQNESLGKRKLAYEIRRFQKGHYYVYNYLSDGQVVPALERELRLNESILRFMTIQTSDNVVDIEARKAEAAEAEAEQARKAAERAQREEEEAKAREEEEAKARADAERIAAEGGGDADAEATEGEASDGDASAEEASSDGGDDSDDETAEASDDGGDDSDDETAEALDDDDDDDDSTEEEGA